MIIINKDLIKWIFVGFISLAIILSFFYLKGGKDYNNEKESTSINANIPYDSSKIGKNSNQEPVKIDEEQVSKSSQPAPAAENKYEKTDIIPQKEDIAENKDIVAGTDLTFDELKALHERQMEEMSNGPSSSIIGYEVAGNPEITFEELKALHEKQRIDIASENNWDEIVVASSGYGETGSGLTRAEVTKLHEKQKSEWVNTDDWDEIHPLESEQDYPLLTTGKIIMLQDEQNINILRDIENPYQHTAPSVDEGGIDITVQEIKELHSKQAKE